VDPQTLPPDLLHSDRDKLSRGDPSSEDPGPEDPIALLGEVAAALRMARFGGVQAVPRPTAAARPAPQAMDRPPAEAPTVRAPQPAAPPRPSQPLPARVTAPQPGVVAQSLAQQRQLVRDHLHDIFGRAALCTKCPRHHGRLRTVAGQGNVGARLIFVLESPDEASEKAARPASGPPGELLDKMLHAMGLHRDEVWLTYLCLCRGGDQPISAADAVTCSSWLRQQWDAIPPQVVVVLGERACQVLLRQQAPMAELRGRWQTVKGVPTRATWGLGEMLADPAKKRDVWVDLQAVMGKLGLVRGG